MNQTTVELQIILPRTQEISRIQHVHQRSEQIQQQCFAAHLANESQKAQKSVQNSPHAREVRIKEKENQNRWQNKDNQKEKPSSKEEESSQSAEETKKYWNAGIGSHIDLKI